MICLIYGEDTSRIQQKINALKKKHHIDTVVQYDALHDPQNEVLMEMDSFSIFDERKMIIVEQCIFLSSKNSTSYDIVPFLERADDPSTILVLVYHGAKLDQRKKLVKQLIQKSEVYACITLDQQSQRTLIHEFLKKENLVMEPQAISWFSSHIGMDALRIESEIHKLKTYADHVNLEDVRALIKPEPIDDVFKMVDALFQRSAIRFLAFYRNFRDQNMEPLAILGLLASQVRFLFQVRVCMDEGMDQDQIAGHLKAHPYRVKLNMEKARSFQSEELLEKLNLLANLDQDMKMGKIDKDQGFENFILNQI